MHLVNRKIGSGKSFDFWHKTGEVTRLRKLMLCHGQVTMNCRHNFSFFLWISLFNLLKTPLLYWQMALIWAWGKYWKFTNLLKLKKLCFSDRSFANTLYWRSKEQTRYHNLTYNWWTVTFWICKTIRNTGTSCI